ncbi:MAG: ATP-binding domain-containing protein, partial [Muribaculaceae bacterium]|nr:ATP-binding domain-containing protein [Muribaculaceae bacterium]
VHAAKGLEFNNVIVVGVEEELFPSAMASATMSEIEEERRLLYVAITRARNFCMLSYASSRFKNGQTKICQPSRFLRDIDPRYLKPVQGTDIGSTPHGADPYAAYRESFHSPASAFTMPATPRTHCPQPAKASDRWQPARTAGRLQTESATPDKSRFTLHQLDEVAAGMEILHERFGKGRITATDHSSSADKIIVFFHQEGVERTLMLKYARFLITEQDQQ